MVDVLRCGVVLVRKISIMTVCISGTNRSGNPSEDFSSSSVLRMLALQQFAARFGTDVVLARLFMIASK